MTKPPINKLQQIVGDYYQAQERDLPWRPRSLKFRTDGSFDAYAILVSEVMLQQTQVSRVIPKYQAFLQQFPTVQSLAEASLGEVLTIWSGLGYNRRAKYLHQAAQQLADKTQPWTVQDLVTQKGIGPNTAAAVCVYADNQPLIFIETNIRAVFIHHFFADKTGVSDREIVALLEQTLKGQEPRTFYWALMDYGSHLKATVGNAASRSKHYAPQSAFAGSRRQLRGQIIRLLTTQPYKQTELLATIGDDRTADVLAELTSEEMITKRGIEYYLS